MQPNGPTQYDFIMNDAPKKKGLFSFGGFGGRQRILAIIIAVGVGLCVVVLLFSLLTGGSNTTTELVSLAQEQTELIRVANVGIDKARTTEGKNLAVTASLSVTSSRTKVMALLAKQHKKLKDKQLALKQSANTDKALETAALNNRFDETFIQTMNDSLQKYQAHLKQIYDMSKSKSEKEVLNEAYGGAALMITGTAAKSS